MDQIEVDERELRLYAFLIKMKRITLEDVPEPYRTALAGEQE